jgi:hypothetical protein
MIRFGLLIAISDASTETGIRWGSSRMLDGNGIAVVMLASCNAARTLQITVRGLARIRRQQDSIRMILSDGRAAQQLGV